jgi:hypothetical protein
VRNILAGSNTDCWKCSLSKDFGRGGMNTCMLDVSSGNLSERREGLNIKHRWYVARHSQTRGVSHNLALPFTFKSTVRQKEDLPKLSNISPCKNIVFIRSSKKNQNPSRYYNSETNLKFQHKPK